MSKYIRVAAVDPGALSPSAPGDPEACVRDMIAHLRRAIDRVLPEKPDLEVLPEACDRYPNQTPEQRAAYFAYRGGRIRDNLRELAKREGCNIAYSAARQDERGLWLNSTQFLSRRGGVDGIYNKNHLVIGEHTEEGLLYGREAPVIETDCARVGGVICFDLNFDELRHKYMRSRPELLVFCSMYHGSDFVQSYWAYSCRAWFVGAVWDNFCTIVNPLGTKVATSTNYYHWVSARINLDYAVVHLDGHWEKLDALRRKYGAEVSVYDPGCLGCVLVSSESPERSAQDLLREFGIETLDDYFTRSSAMRHAPGHIEP